MITYVIYSGDIINPFDSYESGINTYRIQSISMSGKDGDKIFDQIAEKIHSGEELTKQDIISLTFTPIMGGKSTKTEKIVKAIKITKDIDKYYRYDVQSILYAFASKFLKEKDLEKVKEELRVTELGKSLIEEGREQGLKEGLEEGLKEGKELGKAEMLIKLLMKKFKKLPDEYKEKIMKLSNDTLDLIAMEIFEITSVEELDRYF